MHLPDPDAWFASPVFISIEPDGPELANEVTSGLSMTIPPDVEDELEPDTKAAVPASLQLTVEGQQLYSLHPIACTDLMQYANDSFPCRPSDYQCKNTKQLICHGFVIHEFMILSRLD